MKLNELLSKVKSADITGDADVDIMGVDIDSRRVKPGHLFVAVRAVERGGFLGGCCRTCVEPAPCKHPRQDASATRDGTRAGDLQSASAAGRCSYTCCTDCRSSSAPL